MLQVIVNMFTVNGSSAANISTVAESAECFGQCFIFLCKIYVHFKSPLKMEEALAHIIPQGDKMTNAIRIRTRLVRAKWSHLHYGYCFHSLTRSCA